MPRDTIYYILYKLSTPSFNGAPRQDAGEDTYLSEVL